MPKSIKDIIKNSILMHPYFWIILCIIVIGFIIFIIFIILYNIGGIIPNIEFFDTNPSTTLFNTNMSPSTTLFNTTNTNTNTTTSSTIPSSIYDNIKLDKAFDVNNVDILNDFIAKNTLIGNNLYISPMNDEQNFNTTLKTKNTSEHKRISSSFSPIIRIE